MFRGFVHGYREDWQTCLRESSEGLAFSAEHGLVQSQAWHRCIHGWALAHTGKPADGLVEMQAGIEDSMRIMGQVAMPEFHAMLADVLIIRGEPAHALDEVQRMLTETETTHDRYFNAELHRLAAACHLTLGEPEAAEEALSHAVETARAQRALTFELRAATALGRLWFDQGAKQKASALLERALAVLGDAEETIDVRRARSLLIELARA